MDCKADFKIMNEPRYLAVHVPRLALFSIFHPPPWLFGLLISARLFWPLPFWIWIGVWKFMKRNIYVWHVSYLHHRSRTQHPTEGPPRVDRFLRSCRRDSTYGWKYSNRPGLIEPEEEYVHQGKWGSEGGQKSCRLGYRWCTNRYCKVSIWKVRAVLLWEGRGINDTNDTNNQRGWFLMPVDSDTWTGWLFYVSICFPAFYVHSIFVASFLYRSFYHQKYS